MSELARRVGLGLAARGSVSDVVGWVKEARRAGVDSVWIHDSYFERDAVTYAAAIASSVDGINVGLGAVNPFTRHPAVLAMTVSALDDMAPGRIACALGTALPLRLGQMGIPYTPEEGVRRVDQAVDTLRALWRGDRLPPGVEGLPPLAPMFPPVHDVPIFIAGRRSPMLRLCGQKADGYLGWPGESLPGWRTVLATIRRAAEEAGRPPDAVTTAGYLFALFGESRRDALNRAKREPFVIYMLSINTDVALRRAGLDTEIRDAIGEAWRAEEYHRAAEMIPDEMVDGFFLCGTVDDVVARVWEFHEAGMEVPLLQPIVQDEDQIAGILEAVAAYGSREAAAVTATPAHGAAAGVPATESRIPPAREPGPSRGRGKLGAWLEVIRPFSFTASLVPVSAGGALAAVDGRFSWPLFLAALFGALFLHIGTNVTNEIYDVRAGVDSITSPRASHAIVKGRVREREAFVLVAVAFGLAAAIGVWLIVHRGWPVVALGLLGLAGGFGYTAPPLRYKYRALGLPLVFLLMGPLMVGGAYYVVSGTFDPTALVVSLPVGLLVAAILHGNEWRDIAEDARAGIVTLSIRIGRRPAHVLYLALVLGAYLALVVAVMAGALPTYSLLAMLSLPLLVRNIRSSELGAGGQQRAIAMIDLETAQLHAAFGALLVLGLAVAAFTR